jgi:hypothetical protein
MPKYRALITAIVGFVTTALVGAGTAFAQVPPADPDVPVVSSGGGGSTATMSHAGSPIWVFVVVAAITMLVTAAVTYTAAGRRRRLSGQLA